MTVSFDHNPSMDELERLKRVSVPTAQCFQQAQKTVAGLLKDKNLAAARQGADIVHSWMQTENCDENRKTMDKSQKAKLGIWINLIFVQTLEKNCTEEQLDESVSDCLRCVSRNSKILSEDVISTTCKKLRSSLWSRKSPTVSRVMALEVHLFLKGRVDLTTDPFEVELQSEITKLSKYLRSKKISSPRFRDVVVSLGVSCFDFGLWLLDGGSDCDEQHVWHVLQGSARTTKECLFACKGLLQTKQFELASRACECGMQAALTESPSDGIDSMCEELSVIHAKLVIDSHASLLATHSVLHGTFFDETELSLLTKYRRLELYTALESPSFSKARAARLMGRTTEALEELQHPSIASTPAAEFLKLVLECEVNKKLDENRIAQFANSKDSDIDMDIDTSEVGTWLWLVGAYDASISLNPCQVKNHFMLGGSKVSQVVESYQQDTTVAIRELSSALVRLKSIPMHEQLNCEFQRAAEIIECLSSLGEIYLGRGLPFLAKYYFSKIHEIATMKGFLGELALVRCRLQDLEDQSVPRFSWKEVSEESESEVQIQEEMDLGHVARHLTSIISRKPYPEQDFVEFAATIKQDLVDLWYEQSLVHFNEKHFEQSLELLRSNHVNPCDTLIARNLLRQDLQDEQELGTACETCTLDLCVLKDLYSTLLYIRCDHGALVSSMPEEAYLVNSCVGMTFREERAKVLIEVNDTQKDAAIYYWHRMGTVKDAALVQRSQVKSRLDATWVVCTVHFDNKRDSLRICRSETDYDITVVIPLPQGMKWLEAFNEIMTRNSKSISGSSPEATTGLSKMERSKWWDDRYELEQDLSDYCYDFVRHFLGWTQVLFQGKLKSSTSRSSHDLTMFHSADEQRLAQLCLESSSSDVDAKATALVHLCPKQFGGDASKARQFLDESKSLFLGDPVRHPLLLCLSGEIQSIPWESLPILAGQAVCRIPSLPFALESFSREQVLDKKEFGFIVDPENNLSRTQHVLKEQLMGESSQQMWEGLFGAQDCEHKDKNREKIGTRLEQFLTEKSLVLYSGHGGGEEFLDRFKVSRFSRCAPTILMGCSSACRKICGRFEPYGIIDAYVQGNCPLVVGNLWNVTDKDIDRFTIAILESLSEGQRDLIQIVANSRGSCKLPKLVGAAPICYGIPWKVSSKQV